MLIALTNVLSLNIEQLTPKMTNVKRYSLIMMALLPMTMVPAAVALQPPLQTTANRIKPLSMSTETPTALHYRDNVQGEEGLLNVLSSLMPRQQQTQLTATPEIGVQVDLIRNMATSQAVALAGVTGLAAAAMAMSGHGVDLNAIHWNDSDNFRSLFDVAHTSGWRCVQGVLAAMPMIYVSQHVETSDKRDMSHVNFSTMSKLFECLAACFEPFLRISHSLSLSDMVMTLFGRRNHELSRTERDISDHPTLRPETPMMHALLCSTAIAVLTGLSEEIIFRGIIPSAIFQTVHSVPIALFGQAVLFGVGHQSSAATRGENRVIGTLQTVSGVWYGMVYLLAGGDILPAIIAHALYDLHVFMENWMQINDQMDYTEQAVLERLTKADANEVRRIKQEAGPDFSAETLAFLRRFFYAFDHDHAGSLSKSDVQRAISYACLQDAEPPTEDRVNDLFEKLIANRDETVQGDLVRRLMLPEFLRMILFIRENPSKATA